MAVPYRSPWRDLPADFGPWQTVWKRHHRWSLDGTYDEMFAQVAAVFGFDAEMVEDILLSVDSTNVRAHQHFAGARSDTLATGGRCRITRRPPMSPTTTRSAAREAGSRRRSTP